MGKNGKLLLARSDLKAEISEVEIIEARRQKDQAYLDACYTEGGHIQQTAMQISLTVSHSAL